MCARNNAYYVEKQRMGRLGHFRQALESAARWGAGWIRLMSTSSYTFAAYRQSGGHVERCFYTECEDGQFKSTGQWRRVPALPDGIDPLATILHEENQIAAWRHKEESGLRITYQEPRSRAMSLPGA